MGKKQQVLIISGGSKGIGDAIKRIYAQNSYIVFSLARSKADLNITANIFEFVCDLTDTNLAASTFEDILLQLDESAIERLVLINNAGSLGPIGPVEHSNFEQVASTFTLNSLIPMLFISKFLAHTKGWNCQRQIINIGSGAAQKPYFGWTTYCATKAALDMITQVVAVEQSTQSNGSNIISIHPGVVDTGMQELIRAQRKEDFQSIERFLDLKESGQLLSPAYVGQQVFNIDHSSAASGSIIRIS